MPSSRPVAAAPRLSRPAARYRPGKAPIQDRDVEIDSSDSEGDGQSKKAARSAAEETDSVPASIASGTTALLKQERKSAGIVINTDAASIARKLDPQAAQQKQDEDSSSEYETDSDQDVAATMPVFRKPVPQHISVLKQEQGSSEYETDSESSSSESEEEAPPMLKPIFVSKKMRTDVSSDANMAAEEDSEAKAAALAEARRKSAHDLAGKVIRKHLAEQEHASKLASSSASAAATDIDDTDGLDPEGEFQAWRLRELERIKRDQDQASAKQTELEENARIKVLPEAERERLGIERAKALAEEKRQQRSKNGEGKGGKTYYHKGSFFQDMDILKRDYSQMTERQLDKSMLPRKLQSIGEQGVKGRGKWTGLANEDTSKNSLANLSRPHKPTSSRQ